MEEKLIKLRGGSTLVTAEERKLVEDKFSEIICQWRKRKRFFKDIWDSITENSPKDTKEFKVSFFPCFSDFLLKVFRIFLGLLMSSDNPKKMPARVQEELGIEYDEDVGQELQSFSELMTRGKKRKK